MIHMLSPDKQKAKVGQAKNQDLDYLEIERIWKDNQHEEFASHYAGHHSRMLKVRWTIAVSRPQVIRTTTFLDGRLNSASRSETVGNLQSNRYLQSR